MKLYLILILMCTGNALHGSDLKQRRHEQRCARVLGNHIPDNFEIFVAATGTATGAAAYYLTPTAVPTIFKAVATCVSGFAGCGLALFCCWRMYVDEEDEA